MKQIPRIGASLASLCFLAVGLASAQQIVINGQSPLNQPAEIVNNRTMVPLRAVGEGLNANVDWNEANQTINMTKGTTHIHMTVGDNQAMVNDQTITLDVPPQVVDGRTMVPIRFIAEAFGADVHYDSQARIVYINGTPEHTEVVTTQAHLEAIQPASMPALDFSDDASGWTPTGKPIHFVLNAQAGGQASVVMPGLNAEVPMQETSPGHYEATWTPPSDNSLMVNSETAMGKLAYNGQTYYSTQRDFNIDHQPPLIQTLAPADGATIVGAKPTIVVGYLDDGSGIDTGKVGLSVNGQDVTSNCQINNRGVTYTFPTNLTPGVYHMKLVACDRAGNTVTKEWNFTATGSQDTADFTTDGIGTLREGQMVSFSCKAAPGSQVVVAVQNGPNCTLTESSPGVFTGGFKVRGRDIFGGNLVTAVITPPNGTPYTIQCAQRLGVSGDISPRSMAPVIASPLASDAIGDDIVVAGSAPPASTVEIHVSYRDNLDRHAVISGSLADFTVQADTGGNFQTSTIHIPHRMRGSRIRILATTVLPDGTESPSTELVLNSR